MSCDTDFEVLMAYLDGDLDPLERGRVAEHIVGCASCRETVNDLRAVSGALTKWTVPEPTNLPSARELLDRAGVAVPAAAPPRAAWRSNVLRWSAAAMLAIVAGAIAIAVVNTRSTRINESASSKAPSSESQAPPAASSDPGLGSDTASAPGNAPAAPPPPVAVDKAESDAPAQEPEAKEKAGTPADGVVSTDSDYGPQPAPVTAPLEDNLSKDEEAKARAAEPAPEAAANGAGAAPAAAAPPAPPAEEQPRRERAAPKPSTGGGSSIQGAKLTIETTGLDSVIGRVDSAARSTGGKVSKRGPIVRRDGARRVEITVQVPVENMESAISRIKALGTVKGEFRTNRAIGPRLAQLKRDKNEADDGRADTKTQGDSERAQLEAQANVATITVTIVEPE